MSEREQSLRRYDFILKFQRKLNFIIDNKILIVLLFIIIYFSLTSQQFLTYENIKNIFNQISINGIIAIGMTYLLIGRELDLSVGSNMAVVGALIITLQKYNLLLAIIISIFFGAFVGFANGLIVTKLKVNSIAVTLGMMITLRGLLLFLTGATTIKGTNPSFKILGTGEFYKIPFTVIIYSVLLIICGIILSRTFFGRNVYAIGGNEEACRFFGIDVMKNKISIFLLTGILAAIAGVILASRLNVASVQIGVETPIDIIVAVLLGGISLSGGEGSIFRSFQGVLLLGIISNTLQFSQILPYYHSVVKGLLLIFILIIDAWYVRFRKFRFI
ncbi:MAG: ABC transporter permease [Actinobacteria bacterium]|nr:ABC transporter permease [Actinomycetota bacterium]